jgi:hypothetical protein
MMHQLPVPAHQATSALTFVVELVLPLCVWGPRRLRRVAFVAMLGFQVFVILTANYGFFNYLSAALCVWMLDDHDLGVREHVVRPASWTATAALAAAALVLVPVSVVPFSPFLRVPPAVVEIAEPIDRVLDRWRSINAYHLFASMTLVRREPVFRDGRRRRGGLRAPLQARRRGPAAALRRAVPAARRLPALVPLPRTARGAVRRDAGRSAPRPRGGGVALRREPVPRGPAARGPHRGVSLPVLRPRDARRLRRVVDARARGTTRPVERRAAAD